MATEFVSLPIGSPGASVVTAQFAGLKTIVAQGVQGTVDIEINNGGGDWCQVASLTTSKTDLVLTVVAANMRMRGVATGVQVIAERSQIRSAVIPAPPSNGPGASVNVAAFGPLTTICVGGIVSGSVIIQTSADGVTWNQIFKSFTNSLSVQTEAIASRFLRAVGVNAQGTLSLAVASAEDPGSGALSEPRISFIYRPFDPQGPHGNVYTNFADLAEAMANVEGMKILEFDGAFSPAFLVTITPAGVYDMTGVVWSATANTRITGIAIAQGVSFTNLRDFSGLSGGIGPYDVRNQSTISPISDFPVGISFMNLQVKSSVRLVSDAGAAPIVDNVTVGSVILNSTAFSGYGQNGIVSPAPSYRAVAGSFNVFFPVTTAQLGTDTLAGAGFFQVLIANSQLSGGLFGVAPCTWSTVQTVLDAAGGTFIISQNAESVRYSDTLDTLTGATLRYNVLHRITGTGVEVITLPPARRHNWEIIRVKNEGVGLVTVAAAVGEFIRSVSGALVASVTVAATSTTEFQADRLSNWDEIL